MKALRLLNFPENTINHIKIYCLIFGILTIVGSTISILEYIYRPTLPTGPRGEIDKIAMDKYIRDLSSLLNNIVIGLVIYGIIFELIVIVTLLRPLLILKRYNRKLFSTPTNLVVLGYIVGYPLLYSGLVYILHSLLGFLIHATEKPIGGVNEIFLGFIIRLTLSIVFLVIALIFVVIGFIGEYLLFSKLGELVNHGTLGTYAIIILLGKLILPLIAGIFYILLYKELDTFMDKLHKKQASARALMELKKFLEANPPPD